MRTPGSDQTQLLGLVKEGQLWERRDEPAVRQELAERFLGFAKSIALRYRSRAENTEDLMQVAYIGLMNAIERYEPSTENSFRSFAGPTIHGELKRHYRDRVSSIKVPRSLYERVGNIDRTVSALRESLDQEPTTSEIADALDCSTSDVEEAHEVRQSRHPLPLQSGSENDREDVVLEEQIGEVDDDFQKTEDVIVTAEAMSELSDEERKIVTLRFGEELTQSEIAERCDCSQMQISRRIGSILGRLRSLTGAAVADR